MSERFGIEKIHDLENRQDEAIRRLNELNIQIELAIAQNLPGEIEAPHVES